MRKLAFLAIVAALAIAGWKLRGREQEPEPPAIRFSDADLEDLVAPNGRVDLARLAATVPPARRLTALGPRVQQYMARQLTQCMKGALVTGEFRVEKMSSKGVHVLCIGSYPGDKRLTAQWYVPKSRLHEIAGRRDYRVNAGVDTVQLLPTGQVLLLLERPSGR